MSQDQSTVNVLEAPKELPEKKDVADTGKTGIGSDVTTNKSAIQAQPQDQKLVNIPITDQNIALNLMVSFLSLANKRGVFSLDESAKIWECIQSFQDPNKTTS